MKRTLFWFAALGFLLAAAVFGPALFGMPENSFAGLTIYIFLGYCALIAVSQLFSCLAGLRALLEQWTAKKGRARRVFLR